MKTKMLTLTLFISALFFAACGDDDGSKADLRWKNSTSSSVSEIKWKSGSSTNQTWGGTLSGSSETSYKGISVLTGNGECLDNVGDTATINLTGTGSENATILGTDATISENTSATLAFDGTTAK